jgi:hypothetical protein
VRDRPPSLSSSPRVSRLKECSSKCIDFPHSLPCFAPSPSPSPQQIHSPISSPPTSQRRVVREDVRSYVGGVGSSGGFRLVLTSVVGVVLALVGHGGVAFLGGSRLPHSGQPASGISASSSVLMAADKSTSWRRCCRAASTRSRSSHPRV